MNLFRLSILFVLICKSIFCQNSRKLDSLLKVLPTLKEDTTKVKTLIRICHQYGSNNPKRTLEYSEKALILSETIEWKRGIGMAYSLIADAHYYQGNFPVALKYRLLEQEKWKELNYKKQSCSVLGNLGVIYSDIGNNIKAIKCYLDALKSAEEIDDKETMVNSLANIGSLYKSMRDTTKAIEYFQKSLKLAREFGYEKYEAIVLGNLGGIYSDNHYLTKALLFFEKALKIDQKLGNDQNVIGWYANIGGTYQLRSDSASEAGNLIVANGNNTKALMYMNNALAGAREVGNTFLEASILGNMAAVLITQKKYHDAENVLAQSLEQANAIQYFDLIIGNHKRFYELYKKTGNYAKSLEYYEKYIVLKDSISGVENKQNISELQIKFETEKKEAENKNLSQQNKILELSVTNGKYLTFGLTTLLLFLLSLGILIIRQHKLKSKQENVRLEQKLLRTQMNPHFIFNSLSSIESFIYEHQPKEAGNYLSQFARLMRLILENSSEEYISLNKEVETLNYYLALQKLRLNDNLKYTITIDNSLKTEQTYIPPMLTQPFIENAIEHGFRGIKECGEITINFNLKSNYLEIKITDNGIGLVQAQQQKDLYQTHKSMAMQITLERLKHLNKSKKQKLIFEIKEVTEKDHKKGTEVTFSIPFN